MIKLKLRCELAAGRKRDLSLYKLGSGHERVFSGWLQCQMSCKRLLRGSAEVAMRSSAFVLEVGGCVGSNGDVVWAQCC